MFTIAVIGTAFLSSGFGFLIAAVFAKGRISELENDRDSLIGALNDAGIAMTTAGMEKPAAEAFKVVNDMKGYAC